MNSEALLRQYVDTGIAITEHQFDKLPTNLKKTYLRKRFIGIIDYDSYPELFEIKAFSPEQVEKIKKYPRFIHYFNGLDKEKILTNFYNTFDKNANKKDIEMLINITPIGPKLDAVIDRIFKVFGKDISFYDLVSEMMKRYDDIDLKMSVAYKYLDVIEGKLTARIVTEMSYLRDTYRYLICKKLIEDYPSENWLTLIDNLIGRNTKDEYTISVFNMLLDRNVQIFGSTFAMTIGKISDDDTRINLIDKYFKIENYRKHNRSHDFRDLFFFAGDVTNPHYLTILSIYLKYNAKDLTEYDIERLLDKCPEKDYQQAKEMIDAAVSSNELNENLNRIKTLLK